MVKIAIISPYERFAEYAAMIGKNAVSISDNLNVQIDTFLGYFEEGLQLAKEAEAKGYDAIIARGITYKEAKKHVKIPVVNAMESLHDLIRALSPIRGHGYKVNLFLFEGNAIFPEDNFPVLLSEIFNLHLHITRYRNSAEIRQLIDMTSDDFDIFVGGVFVVQCCEVLGKRAVLWETGYDTLYIKIKECINLIKARDTALFQRNQIKTILDYAYEGIFYVDKDLKVQLINPAARKILGIYSEGEELDRTIKNIFLDNGISEIVKSGTGQYEELQPAGENLQIIVNKVPVIIKGKVEGVVINFKEIEQVLQMEKKIRAELWKKGSVAKYSINDIIGISEKIAVCKNLVKKFGRYDSNVLIYGETGTGKELFAQSIHNESKRRLEPFYAINCATLPENLLESELFGYSEGAFTGAKKGGKPGLFELAHNGTLYLDEIGEMPLSFQSKLLRALQEKEIRRIGDDKMIFVNVRIIAASNKNLYEEVLDGNFREDLFYRINVMNIEIAPLRERKKDIPYLINYFMQIYSSELGAGCSYTFDEQAMNFLKDYQWRGNVRELQNFVERVYIYGNEKKVLGIEDIRCLLDGIYEIAYRRKDLRKSSREGTLDNITEKAIREAIEKFGGNKTQAAQYLGVSRSFIWRRLNDNSAENK